MYVQALNAGRGGAEGDLWELTDDDGLEAIMQVLSLCLTHACSMCELHSATVQVNSLSHMLLALELMPLLRAAPQGLKWRTRI